MFIYLILYNILIFQQKMFHLLQVLNIPWPYKTAPKFVQFLEWELWSTSSVQCAFDGKIDILL